jgi:uncharacterized protein (DUF924 family)
VLVKDRLCLMHRVDEIVGYWFGDHPDDPDALRDRINVWFTVDPKTDQYIREHFEDAVQQGGIGALSAWETSSRGRLALIVLLDQFPRNIYRGTPKAFAYDHRALQFCLDGQVCGHDVQLRPVERLVFYLPMQHAEDLAIQDRSVNLMKQLVDTVPDPMRDLFLHCFEFAYRHREIIERFGRFPHRNEILGRVSTREEIVFLKQPGSSF